MGVLNERQNLFLLTLAAASLGAMVLLSWTGERDVPVYVATLTLVYFSESLIFRVRRRTSFDLVGALLLGVFALSIVATFL